MHIFPIKLSLQSIMVTNRCKPFRFKFLNHFRLGAVDGDSQELCHLSFLCGADKAKHKRRHKKQYPIFHELKIFPLPSRQKSFLHTKKRRAV